MLLSICIPTYNRAEYLKKSLESLVNQECWPHPEVEIVISNNASTDDTAAVIAEYVSRYPENIRANNLSSGIDAHDNFDLVLELGRGEFVKLNNDTLMWEPGMLGEFVDMLKQIPADIFLTPSSLMAPAAERRVLLLDGLDDTVKYCSYFLTWIGNLCVRKDLFLALEDRNRKIASRLTQVDVILRLISSGARAVIDGRIFFRTQNIVKNLDYHTAEVFGSNYFDLLGEYLGNGISREVFEKEKKRVLLDFIIPGHFDFFHEKAGIRQCGFWKHTKIYHKDFYFYCSFFKISFLWLVSRFFTHEQLRRLKYRIMRKKSS
ncbi:MAG: glycosyltransferase family 2 protein [Lentisphaerae bacterium]|nr:glycosyltransferase family 2 protein [Lentisphaerota bacterium]MBQ4328599.1 glycosyltransferase family 2 protein [Lentisphaeria bacterium]